MSADTDRWTEIRKIHIESADAYRIMGGIVLVGLGIWIGSLIFAGDNGYGTNLYTELISIGVTVFILDFLNRRRDERHRIEDLKARLLRDIRSSENSVAKQAAHELREHGWLIGETGLLQGANVERANLAEAILWGANFERADLGDANLQGANLMGVNFEGADLVGSNLAGVDLKGIALEGAVLLGANLERVNLVGTNLAELNLERVNLAEAKLGLANMAESNLVEADLTGADLRLTRLVGANLTKANLQGANLWHTSLQGANMRDADLQRANLEDTKFDEQTLLPDGTHWQPDVDLTRFTDPNHLQFWRSNDSFSPAHRGKEDTTS